MKIANREISYKQPPLIIAEIGINHGGNLITAKKMVDLAFTSGCEIIKHQTHFVADEMTNEAKNIFPPNANVSIWEIMEKCALSKSDEIKLKNYVEELGMIYISTPFSRKAADFLAEINVPAFKIGSGESDNIPLIKHIAGFGKPIILSTGMQNINSIRDSVKILTEAKVDFALLECTNLYPSPPEIVSLGGILELKTAFPNALIGFSDHSIGPEMALAAIAMGSCILERHFTDDKSREGPDIVCSMDPTDLRELIEGSKILKSERGGKKSILAEEKVTIDFAYATVVAIKEIKKGDELSLENIWVKRPGTGEIKAESFEDILGKKILNNIAQGSHLKWDDIET